MTVDRVQAQSMGLSLTDVYTAIQLMLAPVYANDFIYGGRVLRVNVQADAQFRGTPDALSHFYVPGRTAVATATTAATPAGLAPMIPISNVVQTKWTTGSPSLVRYNGYEAIDIVGGPVTAHGLAVEWWARTTGRTIDSLLVEAAAVEAGAGGLLALPYFEGERAPRWNRSLPR